MMPKIIYVISEDWYYWSHRRPLAMAAKAEGFDVHLVTRVAKHREVIEQDGVTVHPMELRRGNIDPLGDVVYLAKLVSLYRTLRPDVVHHVAMKPVLYGSMAACIARVPCTVNALAGMGYLAASDRKGVAGLRVLVLLAFRVLLNRPRSRVILQNPDDVRECVDRVAVHAGNIVSIPGSGVDTTRFQPTRRTSADIPTVVMASRLLREKGVREFCEAARELKARGVRCRMILVGEADKANPNAITDQELGQWRAEGAVEVPGWQADMAAVYGQADIAVLPSYYGEGIPKTLIEAAACGLPIVTTNMPGCREVVADDQNGLLVPPRDVPALTEAIAMLVADPALRLRMGAESRRMVTPFAVETITAQTMTLYRQLLSGDGGL